jgi:hypothetical protein
MDSRDPSLLPGNRVRARGVGSNVAGRFEGRSVEAVFDGWDMTEEDRGADGTATVGDHMAKVTGFAV